jgi:hypothetical protein
MQFLTYATLDEFTQRDPAYRAWRHRWREPAGVDHWSEHEAEQAERQLTQTPRQWQVWRCSTRVAFYLWDTVQVPQHPTLDIGCGINWFKRHYPNTHGIDPHAGWGDEHMDTLWWDRNRQGWHSIIAINSLHFCDHDGFAQELARVYHTLAPGGRACVAVNRLIFGLHGAGQSSEPLRDTIAAAPGVTRVVWIDQPEGAAHDGNTWIWLGR